MPLIPDADAFQDLFQSPTNIGFEAFQAQRLFQSNFDDEVACVYKYLRNQQNSERAKNHFKVYPNAPQTALCYRAEDLQASLANVLTGRRTQRNFDPAFRMSLRALSNLLHFSAGLKSPYSEGVASSRHYPSPGGLYPHEIYVVSLRDDFGEPGLYHYNVRDSVLERLSDLDPRSVLARACKKESEAKSQSASTVIFLTCLFDRNTQKYGRRGWKFLQYETGVIIQNFYLVSEALGLGVWPMGNILEDEILPYLGIDGVQEGFMTSLWIGKEVTQSKKSPWTRLISDWGKRISERSFSIRG